MRRNFIPLHLKECSFLRTDLLLDHMGPSPYSKHYFDVSLDAQLHGPMRISNFVANIISARLFRGLFRQLNFIVLVHRMTLHPFGMHKMIKTPDHNLMRFMNSARPIRTFFILLLVNNISMPFEFDILTLWVILLQLITFLFFLFFFVIQYYLLHVFSYILYILHTYIRISN